MKQKFLICIMSCFTVALAHGAASKVNEGSTSSQAEAKALRLVEQTAYIESFKRPLISLSEHLMLEFLNISRYQIGFRSGDLSLEKSLANFREPVNFTSEIEQGWKEARERFERNEQDRLQHAEKVRATVGQDFTPLTTLLGKLLRERDEENNQRKEAEKGSKLQCVGCTTEEQVDEKTSEVVLCYAYHAWLKQEDVLRHLLPLSTYIDHHWETLRSGFRRRIALDDPILLSFMQESERLNILEDIPVKLDIEANRNSGTLSLKTLKSILRKEAKTASGTLKQESEKLNILGCIQEELKKEAEKATGTLKK